MLKRIVLTQSKSVCQCIRIRSYQTFLSLTISKHGVVSSGKFVKLQTHFLDPDVETVTRIKNLMIRTKTGIVAHFYMDDELHGVINKCNDPKAGAFVTIADLSKMSNEAVKQAENDVRNIIVLGVDVDSITENIRTVLNSNHPFTNVYKASVQRIDYALAKSAEKLNYSLYLLMNSKSANSAHLKVPEEIINFIINKIKSNSGKDKSVKLKFILGTEPKMITKIVDEIKKVLSVDDCLEKSVEIIFPTLSTVQAVSAGKCCLNVNGCVTCKFIKMNKLDALENILNMLNDGNPAVDSYKCIAKTINNVKHF